MTNFKGNNKSTSIKTAVDRSNYKLNAFEESDLQVMDFNFAERTFYGRVNRKLDSVIVNDSFLRTFHNQDFSIMNFVGDQFKEMYARYRNALNLSLIDNKDPNLSELKVIRAWESPKNKYSNFMDLFMNDFLEKEMLPNEKKINSFNDFLSMFQSYIMNRDISSKITFSGFLKSKNTSIFDSGLALQLAPVGFSSDSVKESVVLNSPNYKFFMNMAKQFGFSVNLQNPSILVSDLAHPTTTRFREKYMLFDVSKVFDKQYYKASNYDIDLLVKYLVDTYNSFIYLKPDIKKVFICNNKIKSKLSKRDVIDNIDYNIILLLYINIKNMEEFFSFSESEISSMHGTSKRLFEISQEKAVQFIESQFRSRYNTKEGSLTYYLKKLNK